MSDKTLGADAAAVESAGSIAPDAATARPTPGPWTAGDAAWFRGRHRDDTESGKRPITAGDHGVVANVYGKANAHLIAAAPEMYEALIEAERVLRQPPDAHAEIAVLQVIRAALAKADSGAEVAK
jgi:hypothetical protein